MKVFKELPKSLYYTFRLRAQRGKNLIKGKSKIPVIVSLTSIPSRLSKLDLVIKSILNQSVLPEKIVLWLNEDLKNKVPKRLKKLESDIFEIKFSALNCSHRKLIHSLQEYPNTTIITCDDDLIYRESLLEKLYAQHLNYPKDIIANVTTQIKIDAHTREYLPFKDWRTKEKNYKLNSLLPIGAWGILYPPKVMPELTTDIDLFMKLTPKADDLWFKAMALINNVISRQSEDKPKQPIPIIGSQKVSLKNENVKKNKNQVQWKALSDYFDLKEILLKNA